MSQISPSLPIYEHDPIPLNGYIRIIRLLPGQGTAPIRCRLDPISIEEAEDSYAAVSYVWGDPSDTVVISCNRKSLWITPNLFDALHAIRHPTQTTLLWADAISINQKDETEKGHQVRWMSKSKINQGTVPSLD
jgi:Heterokaryon incompatibility protein (HET)